MDRIIDISIAVSLLEIVHSVLTRGHSARTLVRIESPFVTKIKSEFLSFRDKFRVHGQSFSKDEEDARHLNDFTGWRKSHLTLDKDVKIINLFVIFSFVNTSGTKDYNSVSLKKEDTLFISIASVHFC